jgi:hypothetical protein
MGSLLSGYHKKCIFKCKVVRKNNCRRLALEDDTCSWKGFPEIVYSKEKLKNLFDKKRITNLVYLEGLDILKGLRKRKQKEN